MSNTYLVEFLRNSNFKNEIKVILEKQDFDDYAFKLLKVKVKELVQAAYNAFLEQSKGMEANEYVSRYKYFLLLNSCSMSDSVCREAIQAIYGECIC